MHVQVDSQLGCQVAHVLIQELNMRVQVDSSYP